MNRHLAGSFLMGVGLCFGAMSIARAQGYVPPPPTPVGFTVWVGSGSAVAHWTPVGTSTIRFTVTDTGASVTATDPAGAAVLLHVNPSVAHRFTLIAENWGGSSQPAIYTYTPPSTSTPTVQTVPFTVSTSSDAVAGFVQINPGTSQTYTIATRGSHTGALTAYPSSAAYTVVASVYKVTIPQTGYDEYNKCYITVSPTNGQFPGGHRITVKDFRTSNGILSCSVQLQ